MGRPRRPHSLAIPPPVATHHPDLAPEHKAAVVAALRWAWERLAGDSALLASGSEEALTARLQQELNARPDGNRLAPGLRLFETVTRGESQVTVDGRTQKKPDLSFRPPAYATVTNTTGWAWFVECKIIDGAASVGAYCEEGVRRFSSGEYAAWMPSAAMLAYVRDGQEPYRALRTRLDDRYGTLAHDPDPTADSSHSTHDRSKLPRACVDVALTHLWLGPPPT